METTVLGSFCCQPVAAQEARLSDDMPVAVDDPRTLAGWRRLETPDDVFMITNDQFLIALDAIADKGVASTTNLAKLAPEMLKRTVNGTWTAGPVQNRRTADGTRVFQLGTVEIDGEVNGAVFTIWACNEQSIFALALAETTDANPVIDTLVKLRCARPGDRPLPVAK
jgi:hypothetical protein